MARSEEALRRRAEKRKRSVEEQKKIDFEQHRKQVEEKRKKQKFRDDEETTKPRQPSNSATESVPDPANDDRLKEAGSWTCRRCQNHNFASRRWCNSKTCNEPRPSDIPPPPPRPAGIPEKPRRPRRNDDRNRSNPMDEPGAWRCDACGKENFASREKCFNRDCGQDRPEGIEAPSPFKKAMPPRHDEATSKKIVWSSQADDAKIHENQLLRKRYLETNGEGMESEDIERAKTLIARDERKRMKKQKNKKGSTTESKAPQNEDNTPGKDTEQVGDDITEETPGDGKNKKSKNPKAASVSQRDKNKALRKRYQETGGEGMKPQDIERAKMLMERDERKKQRRASSASSKIEAKAE